MAELYSACEPELYSGLMDKFHKTEKLQFDLKFKN